ncbi:M14 family zinc carboxypeptidase [Luteitalea sp.]|uniref:M14 family zinc carboxypeptidase n=1 Tax=Luteitalea sp. TaxID=2004800 RepID=UPI0025B9A0C0|nr:M14 family zinc carboxypeptidase [Luteitalea sp.]
MCSVRLSRWALTACLTLLLGALPHAQPAPTPRETFDPEFARSVREWTTGPEFLSPLVDHLPLVKGIPTPKDVLGYHVGTPKRLTKTDAALAYYRALEKASPRIRVTTIGTTDEGRDVTVVYIASEATLKQLPTHIANLGRLADPRGLSEADAARLVATTPPMYHLMAGLHSAETGPPEMLMELAYRLVASDTPLIRQIRDRVIVSFTPASDPDGRDRYIDWYRKYMVDITEEKDRISGPPYWGKYIFHDNNRDINYSQVTLRAHLEWYLKTHPPVMHDLHESVPFLYTFSGQAPQNPNLDPIVYGELPMFANFEMAQLTKYGMPGVWTHGFVDMWSPGYLAFMASNHNGLVRMYETFGNGGATTMKRRVAPPEGAGQTSREWYRPLPPYRDVLWSLRNNTNYMQTAVLSALQYASAFPDVIVENFYRKSRNSVEAGQKEAPFAFVIPAAQKDQTRVDLLITLLQRQGIEVGRATGEVTLSDGTYAAGSYLVKRNQPYGRLAKTLLEKQTFPDPSLRTYDDTGWTMGLMLQVEVKPTVDKTVLDVAAPLVTDLSRTGTVADTGASAGWVVAHHGSNDMVRLRLALGSGVAVRAAAAAFTVGQVNYPAGAFLVPASAGAAFTDAVKRLGLDAHGLAAMPEVATIDVDLPRLAMFTTWGRTQEVGWVRHAFDTFGIPYDLVYKERIRQGSLRAAYDVILVPHQGTTGKSLVYDVERKAGPLAYRKDPAYPSLGTYGESDDITGGMGLEGVLELQKFVDEGGVLITLGASSYMPAEFGLVREVTATRPTGAFYAPGPIVQVEVLRPEHPIFFGYTKPTLPVRYANGPLFQVPQEDVADQVLMRFTGGDEGVLSGLMRGAAETRRRPALVATPVGKGRVVAFATNPCYRWQNHGEFGMLFNAAVLFWNDTPAKKPATATAGATAGAAH